MKTPKILPWLARRTGVSDERAEDLWRAACQQATALTGERDGPCYWGAAVQTLLDLLEVRGLQVSDAIRTMVRSCTDVDRVSAWWTRALRSSSLDEIFA